MARLFKRPGAPGLAGSRPTDRMVASLGALLGLCFVAAMLAGVPGLGDGPSRLVAPIGASAVLVFAVPSSPLAQPWAIVGGNLVSCAIGLLVGSLVGPAWLAAALAVSAAILGMSWLRCLHPPGGAIALVSAFGAASAESAGVLALLVAANSIGLVTAGWGFHRFSGHSYPHHPPTPAAAPNALAVEDLDAALAEVGESFDIGRADLMDLLERAQRHAQARKIVQSELAAANRRRRWLRIP